MGKKKDLYQVSLKGILKNSNGEVLILKSVGSGTFGGFYDLPGGRIDEDEFEIDFNKILQREIVEEIGSIKFDISDKPVSLGRHLIEGRFLKDNTDIHVLYIFFECLYQEGEIILSEEHENGYDWVDLKSIELEEYFKSGILEGLKKYIN